MGTRDIYVALIVVIGFIICMDFIFNENSQFCILTENFTGYHTSLLEDKVSEDDIKKAKETLEKAEKQKVETPTTKCSCGNATHTSNQNNTTKNEHSVSSFLQSNNSYSQQSMYSNYS
jgi:preprotein translocase subunit SecF